MFRLMMAVMVVTFGIGLGATVASANASVVRGCEGLSAALRNELRAPYRPIQSRLSRMCVDTMNVTSKTTHVFVAAAFYHDNRKVRQTALRKLSGYRCAGQTACREFRELVSLHAKAAGDSEARSSGDFDAELSALREKLGIYSAD